eukprot:TRINITY_DN6199_c0_g2_i1.p1 TRINITY_DN6199_c0_g2~~TRINITY_DN6199_c0_g2_i1.p1  ORF type:complete len:142 (-),score=34.51 TRINITY_DN6199_c0_g2_i1:484-909(-)
MCFCSNKKTKNKVEGIPYNTDLEEILSNEEYLNEFRQFLVSIFAEESLEFYLSVIEFSETEDMDLRALKGDNIISDFISDDAPTPITFENDGHRKNLEDDYKNEKNSGVDSDFFNLICNDIRESLRTHVAMLSAKKYINKM